MTARTWPYGTRKTGEVHVAEKCKLPSGGSGSIVCVGVAGEEQAFVLIQNQTEPVPDEGSIVTIEFTQGGPTGGYWRIVK